VVLLTPAESVGPAATTPKYWVELTVPLRHELLDLAFARLPADLRLQADDTMRALVLTEAGIRDVTTLIRQAEDSQAVIGPPQLASWSQALRAVKAQQDMANSKLEEIIDACLARAVDDDTRTMLQGVFSAFVEGVGDADRDMQEVIRRAAARHLATR
jgi:hypothetical protein